MTATCEWTKTGESYTCINCAAVCAKQPTVPCRGGQLGFGDKVEKTLQLLGITEDRYKEIKRMFGLPPKCNCSKRKAWLNKVSQHFERNR